MNRTKFRAALVNCGRRAALLGVLLMGTAVHAQEGVIYKCSLEGRRAYDLKMEGGEWYYSAPGRNAWRAKRCNETYRWGGAQYEVECNFRSNLYSASATITTGSGQVMIIQEYLYPNQMKYVNQGTGINGGWQEKSGSCELNE